jgi:KEOPS complex subunit Cgi121
MGVSPGEQSVVVLVDAGDDDGAAEDEAAAAVERELRPASTLGAFDEGRVREYFDVGARELAVVDGCLADVVLERVALLDVEK